MGNRKYDNIIWLDKRKKLDNQEQLEKEGTEKQ